jgi:hypothetical protein
LATATAIVYFQQEATLPLQVPADGHSTAIYGALISLNGPVVTAIRIGAARHRLRSDGLVTSAPLPAVTTVVVWTLGEIVAAPVSGAYVAGISPPDMRGRCAGPGA